MMKMKNYSVIVDHRLDMGLAEILDLMALGNGEYMAPGKDGENYLVDISSFSGESEGFIITKSEEKDDEEE